MIFPLSHESSTVRRLPWVTFIIMGICLLAHILTVIETRDLDENLGNEGNELFEYYVEHPYLELDPRLRELLYPGQGEEETEALAEVFKEFGMAPPDSEFLIAQEQEELDVRTEEFFEAISSTPWHEWGLIPADKTLHGFITYQFMHGGWLHLIGNMFFLFLAGPFIEDVWGRPIYLSFYLMAGALSALMYALHYPSLDGPLIGASGAVAGVMGAFLVRYWDTKIKFFYWFFVFFGTFTAPAWLMLPMWLLREVFFAQAMDVVNASGQGSGVAHWAHVWGFAFGVGVAAIIRYKNIEKNYLHGAIEAKVTLFDNSVVEDALEDFRQGHIDKAMSTLKREVFAHPENYDAAMAYWNMATDSQRGEEAAPALMKSIQKAIRSSEIDTLDPYFVDIVRGAPNFAMDPAVALRLGEHLVEDGRRDEAIELLESSNRVVSAATPVGVLVRLSRFGAEIYAPFTGTFIHLAIANADLPEEARKELELLASDYPAPDTEAEAEPSPEPENFPEPESESEYEPVLEPTVAEMEIKVMAAVPVKLSDNVLSLKVGEAARKLDLKQVKMIAVAGIKPELAQSFIVIDMALDELDAEKFRVVRMTSKGFDPCRLMGGEKAIDALCRLIATSFDISGARAVPDEQALRTGRFPRYASLDEYEESLRSLAID